MQCIVVGIDTGSTVKPASITSTNTGDESRTRITQWETLDWVQESSAAAPVRSC